MIGALFSARLFDEQQTMKKRRTSTIITFPFFFDFPEEISFHVLGFLDASDMCSVAKASKALRRMAQENLMWKRLAEASGWAIAASVLREARAAGDFDFKKYFAEKTAMAKKDSLQWSGIAPKTHGAAPSKRFKHSATPFGKYIVYIGGQETDTKRFNEIVFFDTETGNYSRPAIKGDPVPNFSRHSAALVNGRIFIFGGFDGFGTNFDLAIFNPSTFTWTNVHKSLVRGQAPPSRTNHAAAAVGNKMYIFGGNNNSAEGRYQVLEDFYVLDTDTLTWTDLTLSAKGDRPTKRSGHSLTAIGTKLYLFGGGVWNESWINKFSDIYVFDCLSGAWSKPECRGEVDSSTFAIPFAVGRFLFVFGGGSKSKHCVTNELYCLDTSSFVWTPTAFDESVKPLPRDMGTAAAVGSSVYFLGGYAGGAIDYFNKLTLNTKPVFETRSWASLPGSSSC